jgi:hypothetical protein
MNRHKGGGHKKRYRKIEFSRTTTSLGIVTSIKYDLNRNANIASIHNFTKNNFFYILAPKKLNVGNIVIFNVKGSFIHISHRILTKNIKNTRAGGCSVTIKTPPLTNVKIKISSKNYGLTGRRKLFFNFPLSGISNPVSADNVSSSESSNPVSSDNVSSSGNSNSVSFDNASSVTSGLSNLSNVELDVINAEFEALNAGLNALTLSNDVQIGAIPVRPDDRSASSSNGTIQIGGGSQHSQISTQVEPAYQSEPVISFEGTVIPPERDPNIPLVPRPYWRILYESCTANVNVIFGSVSATWCILVSTAFLTGTNYSEATSGSVVGNATAGVAVAATVSQINSSSTKPAFESLLSLTQNSTQLKGVCNFGVDQCKLGTMSPTNIGEPLGLVQIDPSIIGKNVSQEFYESFVKKATSSFFPTNPINNNSQMDIIIDSESFNDFFASTDCSQNSSAVVSKAESLWLKLDILGNETLSQYYFRVFHLKTEYITAWSNYSQGAQVTLNQRIVACDALGYPKVVAALVKITDYSDVIASGTGGPF